MILNVKFAYGRIFTADEQDKLRRYCIGDEPRFVPDGKTQAGALDNWYGFNPMLVEHAADIGAFEASGSTGKEAVARLIEFGQRSTTITNEKVQVAVAGLGLLTVNDVMNENDLCTDRLNELLKQGWRILAVCVQPDQRRPDYILGRTVAEP